MKESNNTMEFKTENEKSNRIIFYIGLLLLVRSVLTKFCSPLTGFMTNLLQNIKKTPEISK